MSEQRRIDLLFAAAVRVFALARLSRSVAPAVAMLLVVAVAVHGTLGGVDVASVPRLAMDVPPGFAQPATQARAHAHAGASPREVADRSEPRAAPLVAETPSRPVPRLDKEQENIARFIAQRYRVGLDATSEFVYHAYRAARDVKVDPMLVLAVMSVESSFNPRAQSPVGAQGLMQVLTRVHDDKYEAFGGTHAAFDPITNLRVGVQVLRECIARAGSLSEGLRFYVGAALLDSDGGYAAKVMAEQAHMRNVADGRSVPSNASNTPPASAREAAADTATPPAALPAAAPASVPAPMPERVALAR